MSIGPGFGRGFGFGSGFHAAEQARAQNEAMERLRQLHEAQIRAQREFTAGGPVIDAEYEVIERRILLPGPPDGR